MSWATPSDVTGSWIGPGVPDDTALVQKWINRAEREIVYRVPDVPERIQEEQPATGFRDTVVDVVVAMVTRVFRNPDGTRQLTESTGTGPFSDSRSVTFGGEVPGGLGLTSDELAKLTGRRSRAYSIDLIPSWSPFGGSG